MFVYSEFMHDKDMRIQYRTTRALTNIKCYQSHIYVDYVFFADDFNT